jgi:hypothetical protein
MHVFQGAAIFNRIAGPRKAEPVAHRMPYPLGSNNRNSRISDLSIIWLWRSERFRFRDFFVKMWLAWDLL